MEDDYTIEVDQYALDREWVDHPKVFYDACHRLADERSKLEDAKHNVDVMKAEVDKEIRTDPDKYGLPKVTEKAVDNAVMLHRQTRKAMDDLLEAKYEAECADAIVRALEHKKRALENLVTLQGQSYFAQPIASGEDAREAADEMEKNRARRKGRKQGDK